MKIQYETTPGVREEIPVMAEIGAWAFGSSAADMEPWFDKIGLENLRVVRDAGKPVGQLGIVWMGQWFGGRPIPMAGIAAVAVAPDRRGHGAATQLMRDTLGDIREAGYPLSALYPATQPIYRSVGYERAGCRYRIKQSAASVDVKERGLDLTPIDVESAADVARVKDLYARRAVWNPGNLDRSDYIWNRIMKPKAMTSYGYQVGTKDGAEGYVFISKKAGDSIVADFPVLDFVALTPRAARRIFSFFADHRSLAGDMSWFGSPSDPSLTVLREQSPSIEVAFQWMIRIVDVVGALEKRGYPAGLETEIHFEVTDELFAENQDRFILQVADGAGAVRRGGEGCLKTDVGGLAAVYSGYQSPTAVRAAGRLAGPDADLAAAQTVFAGPAPWMPDMF